MINKADHPGVENTEKALRSVLDLAQSRVGEYVHHGEHLKVESGAAAVPYWPIPILRTIATEGAGIRELADQIDAHATATSSPTEIPASAAPISELAAGARYDFQFATDVVKFQYLVTR